MATAFELVNGALDGHLEARLRELRAQGLSLPAIAEHFTAQGFPVSRETVRRWLKRLDLPLRVAS
jgi:transposase-like protein